MKPHSIELIIASLPFAVMLCGCPMAIDGPNRTNPNDPDSPYWVTQRPYIQSATLLADSTVQVIWITQTKYATGFRIERRIALTGSYSVIGSVDGSAATNSFIDKSYIPRGHTYGYRVGVVGSAGAVTYSYDYDVDIY